MKSIFSSFSDAALSRAEMKQVKGGNCYVQTSSGPELCPNLGDCRAQAENVHHGHYCCASCSGTNWCKGC